MLTDGDVLGGKYRITGELGRGGMGIVYAAEHVRTQQPLALKFVPAESEHEEHAVRLLREAQNAGALQHENVVAVFDFGRADEGVYLVMEQLTGAPLSVAMQRGAMSVGRASEIMLQVCRGVHAAHVRGILHRDVKPDNIFLCHDAKGTFDGVKVLDFGISKRSDPTKALSLTKSGLVMGTPLYMSPEQLRGKKDLDGRSDLYAIACIYYELLEGCAPFETGSFDSLKQSKFSESIRPFERQVPDTLRDAILRALSFRRGKRHDDLDVFASVIAPFAQPDAARVEASPVQPQTPPAVFQSPPSTGASLRGTTRSGKSVWVFPALLLSLTVLVLVAVGAFWIWKSGGLDSITNP